ncbi:MAG: hypothetical protein EZS28_034854 [Streblomastix strix]|uniref:Uncharacterized protein n=1 Tax=Streblomastix strix TaxID=222440 RepID=A0A5J4UI20_9EUKA|nr:MAG: hypothetical protein EZS28_034854 [Streblomastix strix]
MKSIFDAISLCGGIDVKFYLDISDILEKIRDFFSDLFKQDLSIQSNYIQLKGQFEEVEEQGGDEEIEANIFQQEEEQEEQEEEEEQEEQIIIPVHIPLRFDENKRHEKRMKKLTRKQFINRKEGQFRKMDSADKQMRMKKVQKR